MGLGSRARPLAVLRAPRQPGREHGRPGSRRRHAGHGRQHRERPRRPCRTSTSASITGATDPSTRCRSSTTGRRRRRRWWPTSAPWEPGGASRGPRSRSRRRPSIAPPPSSSCRGIPCSACRARRRAGIGCASPTAARVLCPPPRRAPRTCRSGASAARSPAPFATVRPPRRRRSGTWLPTARCPCSDASTTISSSRSPPAGPDGWRASRSITTLDPRAIRAARAPRALRSRERAIERAFTPDRGLPIRGRSS